MTSIIICILSLWYFMFLPQGSSSSYRWGSHRHVWRMSHTSRDHERFLWQGKITSTSVCIITGSTKLRTTQYNNVTAVLQSSHGHTMKQFMDIFSLPEMNLLSCVNDFFMRHNIDYEPVHLYKDVKVNYLVLFDQYFGKVHKMIAIIWSDVSAPWL